MYSWGQIAEWTNFVAIHIMNYTCRKESFLEYHSDNDRKLKQWYREKIMEIQLIDNKRSINGWSPKFENDDPELETKLRLAREQLTKNLKTFVAILQTCELWDHVLTDELWDHFYNGGTMDNFNPVRKGPREFKRRK